MRNHNDCDEYKLEPFTIIIKLHIGLEIALLSKLEHVNAIVQSKISLWYVILALCWYVEIGFS